MLTLDPPSEAQWHHRAHSQGRSRAKFRGADLIPLKRRQHRPMADGLHGKNLTQSETFVHVETFFARNLGLLCRAGSGR